MGHSALATTARYLHARPAVEQAQVFKRAFEVASAGPQEVASTAGGRRAAVSAGGRAGTGAWSGGGHCVLAAARESRLSQPVRAVGCAHEWPGHPVRIRSPRRDRRRALLLRLRA